MAQKIEDDLLVALADGELPSEALEKLQKLVDGDPDALARLEAFKESGTTLKAMFDGEELQPTPAHIADKIRGLGKPEEISAEVVELDQFKRRREASGTSRFSFRSMQRYAAMLIVGGAIGFMGSTELRTQQSGGTGPIEEVYYRVRGITKPEAVIPKAEATGAVTAYLLDKDNKRYEAGSFIPKSGAFRLVTTLPTDGVVTILYVEGSDPPQQIVTDRTLRAGVAFTFPQSGTDGIQFDTDQPIVSFVVEAKSSGQSVKSVHSFGLTN